MINSLEAQLEEVHEKGAEIERKIEERNSRKKIECAVDSCGKLHTINKLTLLQTHWYTQPHGCTGGDYWNSGEIQFICPDTKIRNRIMFYVSYDGGQNYDTDSESQFKGNYKSLFKEVIDVHKHNSGSYGRDYETWRRNGEKKDMNKDEITELILINARHVNNDYVRNNLKKFELVEKRINK